MIGSGPLVHPVDRPGRDAHPRVCTRADDALRDEYRLAGWVQRSPQRRGFYFGWCDYASRELTRLTSGREESLVWTLVAALAEDESFASVACAAFYGRDLSTVDLKL